MKDHSLMNMVKLPCNLIGQPANMTAEHRTARPVAGTGSGRVGEPNISIAELAISASCCLYFPQFHYSEISMVADSRSLDKISQR